jgi:hypothetical protein
MTIAWGGTAVGGTAIAELHLTWSRGRDELIIHLDGKFTVRRSLAGAAQDGKNPRSRPLIVLVAIESGTGQLAMNKKGAY